MVGILVGTLAMSIIGWNYYRMASSNPGPGGAYSYAQKAFGYDYGFLAAWSLTLAYMAILWANATALVLLVRYMFGDVVQGNVRRDELQGLHLHYQTGLRAH